MKISSRKIKRAKNIVALVLVPLVFVAVNCSLIYIAATGVFGNVLGYANFLFIDTQPDFKGGIDSIFTGYTKPPDSVNTDPENPNKIITISMSEITMPHYETIYGKIEIERVGLSTPLIFGDSVEALKEGAGQSTSSSIPGYGLPIMIGGHNNMEFGKLEHVVIGDIVKITTSYGIYEYEIKSFEVMNVKDRRPDLTRDRERLLLYTCYPFNALMSVNERYFVYADYVSGPIIEKS